MDIPWSIASVIIGLGLALSFLLSGMEAGVFALSRLRIRYLVRAGRPAAKVLHGYLEHPEDFLWTILIGNTAANFVTVSLMVAGLYGWLGGRPVAFLVAVAMLVFLFYTFCDLLPKMLFRQFPNRLCLYFVHPFRVIHALLKPFVAVFRYLSNLLMGWTGGRSFTGRLFGNREELRFFMQQSAQAFTSEERAMINRVLDLQNLTVRQITQPLSQVVSVELTTPTSEALELCRKHGYTRLPVWQGGNPRRIVGLISLRTFLYDPNFNPEGLVRDYLNPALYFDVDLRLEVALQRLQRSGHRLAIVIGHNQREVGIITLQDVLKLVFGEVSL